MNKDSSSLYNLHSCVISLKTQSGAVFAETAISLGVLSLICLAGLTLILNLNRNLDLQDVLRRSAMSIQEIDINPQTNSESVCHQAVSYIEDTMTQNGIQPSDYAITACPFVLGDSSKSNEPLTTALKLTIKSRTASSFFSVNNKVSTVSILQQSIFQKSTETMCMEASSVC